MASKFRATYTYTDAQDNPPTIRLNGQSKQDNILPFKELGIKGKFSSYNCRTTYGTELCEAGLTSKQVGDLMGHADTRMVETVYARNREEGVMKQLDFLNTLNSPYTT